MGLFFVSGFPALLYQVVWQRALFAIYGINIESVTIIVSVFMLGLGLGSMAGGWISKQPRVPLLMVFGLVELGIGIFGIFSLKLFHYMAQFTDGGSSLGTGASTVALLLVPTTLMGSTLPILTEHLVRLSRNVGSSVGGLYAVNTLGSAAACFAAAVFLMARFGESGSVALAASINAIVGLTVLSLHFAFQPGSQFQIAEMAACARGGPALSFKIALPVAGLTGAVSLGYEILWYRAFSMAFSGRAPAFSLLLGYYLAGIAFGAMVCRSLCRRVSDGALQSQVRKISLFVIGANLMGYLVLPAMGFLARYHVALCLPLVSVATALLGATFPLMTHASVKPDAQAGRGLSWLYFSNIVGSTLGSFVVGYVLMDVWTIRRIAVAIALTGAALGAAMLAGSQTSGRRRAIDLAWCAVIAILIAGGSTPLFDRIYERLEAKQDFQASYTYRDVVETRSGVAAVTQDLEVFGGGVYDGIINTDLVHDVNMLYRPFSISLWHPAPREVLVIGLSGGAWTQVIAQHPQVEKVTVVEINPGYLQIIRKYPAVASLMKNPKVSISIDDGRRWLVRNPGARFDVIVSNTTFNWRAHSSNLLSSEFLQLIRRHLKPGGVFFYNTTDSGEAQLTGVTVFPYGVLIGSCLAVSDSPIQLDVERWKRVIAEYKIDGVPVLDLRKPEHQMRFNNLIAQYPASEQTASIRARNQAKRIITDDNMGTEWLYTPPPPSVEIVRLRGSSRAQSLDPPGLH